MSQRVHWPPKKLAYDNNRLILKISNAANDI